MPGISLPNTTPVPNEIINGWVKKLKGSELKVLIIVVRKTLGWILDPETGMRKEEDWITSAQLKEETGLAGERLSMAINDLSGKHKLIQIRDKDGNLLDTAEKRRLAGRQGLKLYYRLNLVTLKETSTYFGKRTRPSSENELDPSSENEYNKINYSVNQLLQNIYVRFQEKINAKSLLTDGSKEKIKTRLKTFNEEQLKVAIDNFSTDDWYMKNCGWRGIAWFFHSDDRIDKFINLKPRTKNTENKDYKGGEYGKYVS